MTRPMTWRPKLKGPPAIVVAAARAVLAGSRENRHLALVWAWTQFPAGQSTDRRALGAARRVLNAAADAAEQQGV